MNSSCDPQNFADRDVRFWIEQGAAIHLKAASSPHGDPVELTAEEARGVGFGLIAAARDLEASDISPSTQKATRLDDLQPIIADAGNVTVPAHLTLIAKDYRVYCEKRTGPDETWIAENEAIKLIAEDLLALLGLVAMWELRGNDWKASDSQIETFVKTFGY